MRRSLPEGTRKILIAFCLLSILGTAGGAVWYFLKPLQHEEEIPVQTYDQKAQVDYKVFFLPNPLFPVKSAGPGQAYIIPLTQNVQTQLSYRFSGPNEVENKGQYQVLATITGYVVDDKGEEQVKLKAWERSNVLVPPTPFASSNGSVEIKKIVPVDVRSYAAFADHVAEQTKFSADIVELSLHYKINSTAASPSGESKEQLAPVVVIPLEGNTFTVAGKLTDQKEGAITSSEMVMDKGVMAGRVACSALVLLFTLLLVWITLGTVQAVEDPIEKELREIMKKHGMRIAAVVGTIPVESRDAVLTVNSFSDLLTIADELARPILYESVSTGIHSFYIMGDHLTYRFRPGESIDFISSDRAARTEMDRSF